MLWIFCFKKKVEKYKKDRNGRPWHSLRKRRKEFVKVVGEEMEGLGKTGEA